MSKKNKNAIVGNNVEILFKNSVGDNPSVVEAIREAYSISGDFSRALQTGVHGNKCDVKMGFTCGRNIDANIKAYKDMRYNQITRMTVENFAIRFDLSDTQKEELRGLVLSKSRNVNSPLIPASRRQQWRFIFEERAKKIISSSFSEHPSREILVLYDRDESIMRIWKMRDVLTAIGSDVAFTPRGNIVIGKCVVFQRKGGNGVTVKVPRTDPKHPGNDIQMKLNIKSFLNLHDEKKISWYEI